MKKDIPLEAIRGSAALVVVVSHTCNAFFPYTIGLYPQIPGQGLQGSPLFVFLNGTAAVALFFVLSGYVLSRRYFELGDNRILLKGAVKRWPGLMGPVFLAVLASYVLFKLHLYQFEQAGAVSGSPWLISFAYGHVSQPVQLWDALRQGAFITFFRGDWYYDGPTWTMRPELIGSFIVFGFAPILFEARKSSLFLALGLVGIVAVLARYADPSLVGFPIGVGLAALIPRAVAISSGIAYPALLIALYFLGFSGAFTGIYAAFYYPVVTTHLLVQDIHLIGAAILIAVIETFPPIRRAFSGRISQFLGELSFPIYLLHFLVICSVGSLIYLWAGPFPAALTVFSFSILVSLPLMGFNNWWVKQVDAATALMIRERPLGIPATQKPAI